MLFQKKLNTLAVFELTIFGFWGGTCAIIGLCAISSLVTHIASHILRHAYCVTHIASRILLHAYCFTHIALCILHCTYCVTHIALCILHCTYWVAHIASHILRRAYCVAHIASRILRRAYCIAHIASRNFKWGPVPILPKGTNIGLQEFDLTIICNVQLLFKIQLIRSQFSDKNWPAIFLLNCGRKRG
jgi:hypothetical protein